MVEKINSKSAWNFSSKVWLIRKWFSIAIAYLIENFWAGSDGSGWAPGCADWVSGWSGFTSDVRVVFSPFWVTRSEMDHVFLFSSRVWLICEWFSSRGWGVDWKFLSMVWCIFFEHDVVENYTSKCDWNFLGEVWLFFFNQSLVKKIKSKCG